MRRGRQKNGELPPGRRRPAGRGSGRHPSPPREKNLPENSTRVFPVSHISYIMISTKTQTSPTGSRARGDQIGSPVHPRPSVGDRPTRPAPGFRTRRWRWGMGPAGWGGRLGIFAFRGGVREKEGGNGGFRAKGSLVRCFFRPQTKDPGTPPHPSPHVFAKPLLYSRSGYWLIRADRTSELSLGGASLFASGERRGRRPGTGWVCTSV